METPCPGVTELLVLLRFSLAFVHLYFISPMDSAEDSPLPQWSLVRAVSLAEGKQWRETILVFLREQQVLSWVKPPWGSCQLHGSIRPASHCWGKACCLVFVPCLLPKNATSWLKISLQQDSVQESDERFWHRMLLQTILPLFRAFSGMILWAVIAELLFSTTANRRKTKSSKWTRKRNCSFHIGLSVLRWMGLVRKWQLSRGIPSTSISMQGLPVLLLGHTFCPDTIWSRGVQMCELAVILFCHNFELNIVFHHSPKCGFLTGGFNFSAPLLFSFPGL